MTAQHRTKGRSCSWPNTHFTNIRLSLLSLSFKTAIKRSPRHLKIINNLVDGLVGGEAGLPLQTYFSSTPAMTSKIEGQALWHEGRAGSVGNRQKRSSFGLLNQQPTAPSHTFHDALSKWYGRFLQIVISHPQDPLWSKDPGTSSSS